MTESAARILIEKAIKDLESTLSWIPEKERIKCSECDHTFDDEDDAEYHHYATHGDGA